MDSEEEKIRRKFLKEARLQVKEFETGTPSENSHLRSIQRVQYKINKRIVERNKPTKRNCMKEFKFISEIKTKSFNNSMYENGLISILMDDDYNLSQMFQRDIINPVKKGTFTVFGIIGQAGSGKSELAQTIAFISKEANKKYMKRDVKIHLVWTQSDFNNILPILKKGDIIWKDEMPKTLRKGARIEKWQVNNVLHIIRKFENTLIFLDPVEVKVDICDTYLQSAGMNFDNRVNRFLVLNMDNIFTKKYTYIGHIYTKLHNNDEFREWYENEKEIFIQKMLNIKGDVRVETKEENLLEDKTKEENLLEDKTIKENQIIEENPFKYTITDERIFDTIKREVKWYDPYRDIEIFKEHKAGKLIEDIMKDTNTTESNVKRIIRQVQGAVYKYKGLLFEKEYFKWLKLLGMYDKVIWDGTSGEPDIYVYDEDNNTLDIFSLKNYTIKKRPFHIKSEEFGAELKRAYKEHLEGNYKEIKLFTVIYDSVTDKVEKIKLDYLNPENIILH